MANKAQERLKELGLFLEESEATYRDNVARGGEILSAPIRPSQSGQLDPSQGTPFLDFKEYFLNNLGISTERQRTAATRNLQADFEDSMNAAYTASEKLKLIKQRGVGGINQDRLKNAELTLQEAITRLDSPSAEVRERGRIQLENAYSEMNNITNDQDAFIDQARNEFQSQINSLVDIARYDQRESDGIDGVLAERINRNGMSSNLSITEKEMLSTYLSGGNFSQSAGDAGALGISVPYDTSEQITAGDALVLLEAVKQRRQQTITSQLSNIGQTLSNTGLAIENKDGKLLVNEIVMPDLYSKPSQSIGSKPLNIKAGLPTTENAEAAGKNIGATIKGVGKGLIESTGVNTDSNVDTVVAPDGTILQESMSDKWNRFKSDLRKNRELQKRQTN